MSVGKIIFLFLCCAENSFGRNDDFVLLDEDVHWRTKRHAFSKIWQSPLHYEISDDFTDDEKQVINDAIAVWSDVVCLQFVYHTDTEYTDDKLVFVKQDGKCVTHVGHQVKPVQVMKLDCDNWQDRIVRGIGHILGLWRENMRPDRDEYIITNYDNIPLESQHLYGVKRAQTFGVPYDYNSVMHTWPREHTIDPNVDSLHAVPGPYSDYYQAMIGQNRLPTFFDRKTANMAYDSVCGCISTSSITCENGGYHNTKDNCVSCICPDGYGGVTCSDIVGTPGCSPSSQEIKVTTSEQCVETPGYGTGYSVGDTCAWLLKSDPGSTIEMYFSGNPFDLLQENGRCQHWIELKINTAVRGPRFCGQSLNEFTSSNPAVSISNEAMIYFDAKYSGIAGTGARICFRKAFDECDPNPCLNGGVCHDGVGSFTCQCPAGITGAKCETNIDECASNPCKNGGTCIDLVNGCQCKCKRKYFGAFCERRKRRRGKK